MSKSAKLSVGIVSNVRIRLETNTITPNITGIASMKIASKPSKAVLQTLKNPDFSLSKLSNAGSDTNCESLITLSNHVEEEYTHLLKINLNQDISQIKLL